MTSEIDQAEALALHWHRGQKYGDVSYINHLKDVVDSLEFDKDIPDDIYTTCVIVAYLHDILEDTECEVATIGSMFGNEVVEAVQVMTKKHGQKYEDYMEGFLYNTVARIVKTHDTMCNLRASINDCDKRRMKKYTKQLAFLL